MLTQTLTLTVTLTLILTLAPTLTRTLTQTLTQTEEKPYFGSRGKIATSKLIFWGVPGGVATKIFERKNCICSSTTLRKN